MKSLGFYMDFKDAKGLAFLDIWHPWNPLAFLAFLTNNAKGVGILEIGQNANEIGKDATKDAICWYDEKHSFLGILGFPTPKGYSVCAQTPEPNPQPSS